MSCPSAGIQAMYLMLSGFCSVSADYRMGGRDASQLLLGSPVAGACFLDPVRPPTEITHLSDSSAYVPGEISHWIPCKMVLDKLSGLSWTRSHCDRLSPIPNLSHACMHACTHRYRPKGRGFAAIFPTVVLAVSRVLCGLNIQSLAPVAGYASMTDRPCGRSISHDGVDRQAHIKKQTLSLLSTQECRLSLSAATPLELLRKGADCLYLSS